MTKFYVKVETEKDEFHVDTSGTYPRISLTAPASQERANSELVRELSAILEKSVSIVSGHNSRRKQLAVDIGEDEIRGQLKAASG